MIPKRTDCFLDITEAGYGAAHSSTGQDSQPCLVGLNLVPDSPKIRSAGFGYKIVRARILSGLSGNPREHYSYSYYICDMHVIVLNFGANSIFQLYRVPTFIKRNFLLNSPKHQSGENFVCSITRKERVICLCKPVITRHCFYSAQYNCPHAGIPLLQNHVFQKGV